MSPLRRTVDIALNFIIPTTIMLIVIWRLAQFFDYRFNLLYQASNLFRFLPDIGILMLVGTVPDYVQGVVKLWWVLRPRRQTAPKLATAA
jgi:hypothetical protein